MIRFAYEAASDVRQAIALGESGTFIAGGTNLLDLMKEGITRPQHLIDINGISLASIESSEDGGLMLGALARNAETAYHPLVRTGYPLLSVAILSGASPQIRNMATDGGNLLQRTRCYYFYDTQTPCNKRELGSGCSAIGNLARQHAILGSSPLCIATHPSDMCVALAALGAVVHVESENGVRSIPFGEFHRLPGDRPDIDNTLHPGELVTHIQLPPAQRFAKHCAYLKIRERASYAFALVSVAAAVVLDESNRIVEARLSLGGVAHKPWRLVEAEELLRGRSPDRETFIDAANVLLAGAQPQGTSLGSNSFKIPMARRAVVRAFEMALGGQKSLLPNNPMGEQST